MAIRWAQEREELCAKDGAGSRAKGDLRAT